MTKILPRDQVVSSIRTVKKGSKNHEGITKRPTETPQLDNITSAEQKSAISTAITAESPYNNNFGGCQTAMDAARRKDLEEAQKHASSGEKKG